MIAGSDSSAERRARLRSSAAHDVHRKAVHDFRNRLNELLFAVGLNDEALVRFYMESLVKDFEKAIAPKGRS